MENDRILFTIGRMNPPTTGHMLLIERMIENALERNIKKVYLILSATVDNKKNPMECIDKQKLLLNFIIEKIKQNIIHKHIYTETQLNHIDLNIICTNDNNISGNSKNPIVKTLLFILGKYKTSNMVLMIGQDRENDFAWIKELLLNRENPIHLEIITVERPDNAISATEIRNLAINGNFEEFSNKMIDTGIDNDNILKIYEVIKTKIVTKVKRSRSINTKNKKTKHSSKSPSKSDTSSPKKTRTMKKTYKKI